MTDRKQALERTAVVRAKITAYLANASKEYSTLGDIREAVPEIDEVGNISSLLGTMVNNGLIKSKELTDNALYSRGYCIGNTEKAAETPKRAYNRKASVSAVLPVERPEVTVEADRIVIDRPKCRIIVELK